MSVGISNQEFEEEKLMLKKYFFMSNIFHDISYLVCKFRIFYSCPLLPPIRLVLLGKYAFKSFPSGISIYIVVL